MAKRSFFGFLRSLARDRRGAMVIEVAVVTPVLAMMAIGAFEVARMVTRQQELQSGALEGQQIALAANAGATTDVNTVKTILMGSLQLGPEQVTVQKKFRCNMDSALVDAASLCAADDVVSSYIEITLTDAHDPVWTQLGFGTRFNYRVVRLVQLS